MNRERKIAILTSGMSRGSNFVAIYNQFKKKKIPVKIEFVTVSNLNAPIIGKCSELGVKYVYLPTKDMVYFEKELLNLLKKHSIELVALAGFLKKLSADFINKFGKPVLNIHPALLPEYCGKGMYGIKVHQAVMLGKEKESGVTVHLVNEEYDAGQIIVQKRVNIEDCQSPEEIAAKVLKIEHEIYARAIWDTLRKSSKDL